MATTKTKRSLPQKATRRNNRRVSTRQTNKRRNKPYPGEFALQQRTLPNRSFVDFPLVKGKAVERVQLFTTENCGSLTIEFQDQTSLHLEIEPGFTIQAELQQLEKGELKTLAEWPPIHSQT